MQFIYKNSIKLTVFIFISNFNLYAQSNMLWLNQFGISLQNTDGIVCQDFQLSPDANYLISNGNYLGTSAFISTSAPISPNLINFPASDFDGFITFTNSVDGSFSLPNIFFSAGGYLVDSLAINQTSNETKIHSAGRYYNSLSVSAPINMSLNSAGEHTFLLSVSNLSSNLIDLSSCPSNFCGLWIHSIHPSTNDNLIFAADYLGNLNLTNGPNLNSNNYNTNSLIAKFDQTNQQWIWHTNLTLNYGNLELQKLASASDNTIFAIINSDPTWIGITPFGNNLPSFSSSKDILLVKLDPQGQILQSQVYNSMLDETARDLISDANTSLYFSGTQDLLGNNANGIIKKLNQSDLRTVWDYSLSYPNYKVEIQSIFLNQTLQQVEFLASKVGMSEVSLVRGSVDMQNGNLISLFELALPLSQSLNPNKPTKVKLIQHASYEYWSLNYADGNLANSCYIAKFNL